MARQESQVLQGSPSTGFTAIDGLGQYAGGAGLAAAARAAEQVGMGDAAALNGIAQCLDDVLLAGYFIECLGAPFAVKNLGSHSAVIIPQPRGG